MRLKKLILFLTLVVFISCSNLDKEQKSNETERIEFIGKWNSVKRIYPYRADLTIKKDKSFSFNYGACESSGFSIGTWELKDQFILLNSDKIDSCLYTIDFGLNCIAFDSTIKIDLKTTQNNCIPENEIDYIVFKNEIFYLKNDTLIHKNEKDTLCPEIKDIFYK